MILAPLPSRSTRKRQPRRRQLARGLTRIRLGGALGRKYGREHCLAVSTPAEAIAALDANHPGFKATILQMKGHDFIVRAGGKIITERAYRAKQTTGTRTISFVPTIKGSANTKGLIQAIAGVVIVIAAVAISFASYGTLTPLAAQFALFGVGLIIGGVASLLAGTPGTGDDSQKKTVKPNAQFDGPQTVTQQGAPIAVVYGELLVSGNLISESIESVDVAVSYEDTATTIVPPDVTVTPGTGASFHAVGSDPTDPNADTTTVSGGGGVGGGGVVAPNAISSHAVGGASGGSSSSSTGGKEASDTLHSTQMAKLQILHGIGPVDGIVGGMQGVFVDQTPFQNPDGTGNFKNWQFDFRDGSPDQDYISGFDSSGNSIAESVEVKAEYPFIRHIDDTTVDAVRVDIRYPQLQSTNTKNGNIDGTGAEIGIDLSQNGGAWQTLVGHYNGGWIVGKSSAPYTRSYEIKLPSPGPWDVRVRRVTPDSTSTYLQNRTFVDALTLVTYGKFSQPGCCISALQVDAQQFSSIPSLAVKLRGRQVQVPTNFDPLTRTFGNNGQWDGTFKTAWTDDPAWIFYDFATNSEFGAGNAKAASGGLKWELYACSQYNSQLVPNGNGGTEPRFTCNTSIAQAAEIPRVLSNIASSMGAFVYFRAGEIGVSQDRPRTYTAKQFLPENVENGLFTYVGTAKDARHNLARVTWNDPTNFYAADVEPYEDGEALSLDGGIFNPLDVTGFGCTSRGAAYRLGRYSIITEQLEGEGVTFVTGLEAADLTPGDVIQIANPFRSGSKTSQGRIKAVVSPTILQLDRVPDPTVLSGSNPKLCIHYQGTNEQGEACTQVASVAIDVANSAGDTIHLLAAPPDVPLVNQAWGILSDKLQPELWRVLGITHEGGLRHTVAGHRYNASKFDAIDLGFNLITPPTSLLPNAGVCQPPGALTVNGATITTPAGVTQALEISCAPSPDPLLDSYEFSYRINSGNWIVIDEPTAPHATLSPLVAGDYEIRACAKNRLGVSSAYVTSDYSNADGSPLLALSITGLELTGKAHDLVNEEPDFHFAWRLNSPALSGQVGGDDGTGLSAGMQDPTFGYYAIQIRDATGASGAAGSVVWTDKRTTPGYTFTEAQNSQAFGGNPRATIIFGVQPVDVYGKPGPWVELQVSNPAPPPCGALTAQPSPQSVDLAWLNPSVAAAPDLAGVELLESQTGSIADAKVINVGLCQAAALNSRTLGKTYTYWVRCYDTFGSRSATFPSGAGVSVTIGSVDASDVVNLDVALTTKYPNTVIIEGVVWGNHDPDAASISWTCPAGVPCLAWHGQKYVIASGSTALEFVWWKAGETAFRTSDTNPETDPAVTWDPLTCFQIATNYEHTGVPLVVWNYTPNATVGSIYGLRAAFALGVFDDLIATRVNVIGTLQLDGQAVTLQVTGQGADVAYADWTTVFTLSVASTGSPAEINCSWGESWASTVFAATRADWRVVRSDGLQVGGRQYSSFPGTFDQNRQVVDSNTVVTTPGNPASYSLQLRRSDIGATTFYNTTALAPIMDYHESKR